MRRRLLLYFFISFLLLTPTISFSNNKGKAEADVLGGGNYPHTVLVVRDVSVPSYLCSDFTSGGAAHFYYFNHLEKYLPIEVDYINISELNQTLNVDPPDVLVLEGQRQFPSGVDIGLIDNIDNFVNNGGSLIATGPIWRYQQDGSEFSSLPLNSIGATLNDWEVDSGSSITANTISFTSDWGIFDGGVDYNIYEYRREDKLYENKFNDRYRDVNPDYIPDVSLKPGASSLASVDFDVVTNYDAIIKYPYGNGITYYLPFDMASQMVWEHMQCHGVWNWIYGIVWNIYYNVLNDLYSEPFIVFSNVPYGYNGTISFEIDVQGSSAAFSLAETDAERDSYTDDCYTGLTGTWWNEIINSRSWLDGHVEFFNCLTNLYNTSNGYVAGGTYSTQDLITWENAHGHVGFHTYHGHVGCPYQTSADYIIPYNDEGKTWLGNREIENQVEALTYLSNNIDGFPMEIADWAACTQIPQNLSQYSYNVGANQIIGWLMGWIGGRSKFAFLPIPMMDNTTIWNDELSAYYIPQDINTWSGGPGEFSENDGDTWSLITHGSYGLAPNIVVVEDDKRVSSFSALRSHIESDIESRIIDGNLWYATIYDIREWLEDFYNISVTNNYYDTSENCVVLNVTCNSDIDGLQLILKNGGSVGNIVVDGKTQCYNPDILSSSSRIVLCLSQGSHTIKIHTDGSKSSPYIDTRFYGTTYGGCTYDENNVDYSISDQSPCYRKQNICESNKINVTLSGSGSVDIPFRNLYTNTQYEWVNWEVGTGQVDSGVFTTDNNGNGLVSTSLGSTHYIELSTQSVSSNISSSMVFGLFLPVNNTTGETLNSPPSADFSWTADGLTVTFTDNSTDSDGIITSWNWNFGDGEFSTVQNPIHIYPSDGSYNVTLNITDDNDATDMVMNTVLISNTSSGYIFGDGSIPWYYLIGGGALVIFFPFLAFIYKENKNGGKK